MLPPLLFPWQYTCVVASTVAFMYTTNCWYLVRLNNCYALGLTLANTWVRFSTQTKGDIHKSMLI